MSRRVLIDCGANHAWVLDAMMKQRPDFDVIAFEPNARLHPAIDRLRQRHPGRSIEFHPEAVWTHDGEIDFYLDQQDAGCGSTLLQGKVSGKIDYAAPVHVRSIDFAAFIVDRFRPEDYVVLKMDIEGAEYDVLERMLERGAMARLRELWVEFHQGRIAGITRERHDALIERLRGWGAAIFPDNIWLRRPIVPMPGVPWNVQPAAHSRRAVPA